MLKPFKKKKTDRQDNRGFKFNLMIKVCYQLNTLHSSDWRRFVNKDRKSRIIPDDCLFFKDYSRVCNCKPSQCSCKTVEIDDIQAQKSKGLVYLNHRKLCAQNWAGAYIDVKLILVRKFSRLPQFSEKSGTIKNSLALWEMSFHPFYLQRNMQKSNQRVIWINEAVCPSLQRRRSPACTWRRPPHPHAEGAEVAWWWGGRGGSYIHGWTCVFS